MSDLQLYCRHLHMSFIYKPPACFSAVEDRHLKFAIQIDRDEYLLVYA